MIRIDVAFLTFLAIASGQDRNCDYTQNVQPNQNYYVYSPRYPQNYTPGIQCRWIATCPSGYNCRLDCTEINIPQTPGCAMDRFLISRNGDPQLSGADQYCGRGNLTAVSSAQRLSIGLISSLQSPGGRVYCNLYAQQITTTPPPPCTCGYKKQNRIVGGVETGVNEFPMMAAIVDASIYSIKCGGVIISNRHVLTAAHCLANQQVSNIAVLVGEHDITTDDSPATRGYRSLSFIIHPQYNSQNFDYDIGIILIDGTITFSGLVGPVCLPFKFNNTDFTGRTFTLLGWGTTSIGGMKPNALRKVDVTAISQNTCAAQVNFLSNRQICHYSPGKDACQDDSGGPAMVPDPATGLLFSIGIISSGQSCASNSPGINTRVTAFLSWILSVTPGVTYCVQP